MPKILLIPVFLIPLIAPWLSGAAIALSSPDNSLLEPVSAIPLSADLSCPNNKDGEKSLLLFTSSAPASTNKTEGFNSIIADTVKFSFQGGYFPGGLEIRLSTPDPLDTIVYTLDGSKPTSGDNIYTIPLIISKNTVLRARSLNSQKLPGIISTNTYFTRQHSLPVVCLSTDPDNLWDYNTGIYVLGPNASPSFPNKGANFWEDWEREAHMELYDIEGIKQIDQDIGIKIYGAYSRAHPMKSLALYARKEYGRGSLKYKFFKDKPITEFESLILRNAGNDWAEAGMRDGLTVSLIKDMNIDRQAFQPSIVYLNGTYWGIHNLREKINPNFLSDNHFIDPDNVNLLEKDAKIVDGSNASYLVIKSYLNTHTLVSEKDYLEVSNKIDIENYIQYMLTQIYIHNKDWPGNNIKYWRTNEPESLWRWIIYDTDVAWGLRNNYAFNTIEFNLDPSSSDDNNPPWSTLLFRRMMSNPGFRKEFASQFADRINTNFSSAKVNATIDSLKQLFLPEINNHLIRWGLSQENWQNNYTMIKTFATARPAYVRNFLNAELGMPGKQLLGVEIVPAESGSVKVNSVIPEKYPFSGVYFKNLPVRLTAIPGPGYKFAGWEGTVISNFPVIEYDMAANASMRVVFEPAGNEDYNIVINEINYSSSSEKDPKDWVELFNAGSATVNIKNWVISDAGFATGYVFPADILFAPGMYLVICRDMQAFRQVYPDVSNVIGDIGFGLGSTGDDVNLFDAGGALIDFVNYTTNLPWPADANGTGASIELENPLSENNMGYNWKSSPDGGTPGALNLTILKDNLSNYSSKPYFSMDCYPNPFTDFTTLRIESAAPGNYKLEVYDLQGRLINILTDQFIDSGAYYIDWDGRDSDNVNISGGVYMFRLSGENQITNLKVIYIQ